MCPTELSSDLRLDQISNTLRHHPISCYASKNKTKLLCRGHFKFSSCIKYYSNEPSKFLADNSSRSNPWFIFFKKNNQKISDFFGSMQVNYSHPHLKYVLQINISVRHLLCSTTTDSIKKCSQLIITLHNDVLHIPQAIAYIFLNLFLFYTKRTLIFLPFLVLSY